MISCSMGLHFSPSSTYCHLAVLNKIVQFQNMSKFSQTKTQSHIDRFRFRTTLPDFSKAKLQLKENRLLQQLSLLMT